MRVSEREIKGLLHESNLIEGYDDAEFDAQSLHAWRWLIQYQQIRDIGRYDVCKIQKMITLLQDDMRPDWRGYYRKHNVQVGGRICMAPEHIDRAMEQWFDMLEFTVPQTAHVEFEKIHPFADGNGRTGRMLMWWQQLVREEPLTKLSAADRQSYYAWFK